LRVFPHDGPNFLWGSCAEQRMKMAENPGITLEKGCDLFLLSCRQRNLMEATVRHYQQSNLNPFIYFYSEIKLTEIDKRACCLPFTVNKPLRLFNSFPYLTFDGTSILEQCFSLFFCIQNTANFAISVKLIKIKSRDRQKESRACSVQW